MPSLTKIHADFVGPLSSGTASAPILKFSDSSTTGIFSPNTGEIAFSTSGQSQAVTFKTDGKVGIGINSPVYNLDVIGDINFTGTLRQNGSAFSGGGGGGGGGSNWTTSGNNIYRQSKVGINQNNPTDNLEILHTNGNGITFKTSQNHYAQITSDVNRTSGDNFLLAIEGKWNGTPVAEIALVTGSDTTAKDDGEIIFKTSSEDNLTNSERLRITSDGEVRVNNAAGASVGLNLYQISGAAAQVRFQGSATGTGEGDGFGLGNSGTVDAYVWNYEAGHIQFATSNSPRLTITSAGNVRVPDNGKFTAGAGDDLQIYHTGSHSFIVDSGVGDLYIRASGGNIQDQGNANQSWLQFNSAAGVEAHFAGNKKLETTNTGVTVTGTLAATAVTGDGSGLTSIDATTLDGEAKSYYTGYTDTAIANLVDSSPSTLNTLNELAAALGDDANFSTTVTTSIAAKLPLAGGTMTGTLNMGSNNITTTGKVLFANMYSALGDLPSASTYHGMFAHVHGTGKGYFAHGGNWIRLLDTNDEGSGNGLDADTVDGQEGSYYLNYNNFTNTPTQTDNNFTTTLKNKLDGIESSATADQTAAEILTAIKTVDGASSGLDSDTLDGLQGSAYLNKGSGSYYQPDTWIDFNTTNVGLYWSGSTSAGWHIYPADASNMRFRTSGNTCALRLDTNNGTARGSVYADNSNNIGFLNNSGNWRLKVPSSGNILRDTYTIWDSGNDGTGSGLDADTVDGLQASEFLRSNATDTCSGQITHTNKVIIDHNTSTMFEIKPTNGGPWAIDINRDDLGSSRVFTHNPFPLESSYGWVFEHKPYWYNGGSYKKFLTTADEGSGNGLDADTLDGLHASSFITSTSATTFTGDLTISKNDARLKLNSTDSSSPNYPGIDFDEANNQGASLELNIFDGELPTAGLGLVVKKSASNTETGTLTFNVLGDIYTGGTSLSTLNKVLTTDSNGNLLLPDGKHIYMSGFVNNNTFNSASLFVDAIKCGNLRIHDGRQTSGGASLLHNTIVGNSARTYSFADGDRNTAVGSRAGYNMSTGHDNTLIGYRAQDGVTTGGYGTFIGVDSGKNKQYGDYCTAIGYQSDFYTTTGSNNSTANYSNTTCLGYDSRPSGSNQVVAGNTSATLHYYGLSNRSDERDKIDIQDEFLGLDFIKKLKPRAYKWDYRDDYFDEVFDEVEDPDNPGEFDKVARLVPVTKDGSRSGTRLHHGLIAQEVKELIDETGVDFAGYQDSKVKNGEDVLSMNYLELIAPMIKAIQEQQAQIEALTAMIESMK